MGARGDSVEDVAAAGELDEPVSVQAAWTLFDLQERELWDEFAADPHFLSGQAYIRGEHLFRHRMERSVQSLRYRGARPVRA